MKYTEKMMIAHWQNRYRPQPVEKGQADYWGASKEMVWVSDSSILSNFISYNGKYVVEEETLSSLGFALVTIIKVVELFG